MPPLEPDQAATRIQKAARQKTARFKLAEKRRSKSAGYESIYLFWNADKRDHRVGTKNEDEKGYVLICEVGMISKSPDIRYSEGLYLTYSDTHDDSSLCIHSQLSQLNGSNYSSVCLLGYIHSNHIPGMVPLTLRYCSIRQDSLPVSGNATMNICRVSASCGSEYSLLQSLGYIVSPGDWKRKTYKNHDVVPHPPKKSQKGKTVPSSDILCNQLTAERSRLERLWDIAFPAKIIKLDKDQQGMMVRRLHYDYDIRMKQRKEKLERLSVIPKSRLTYQEERDFIERMFYDENKKASELAERLSTQFTAENPRKRLTKEAQQSFAERLARNAEEKKDRHRQRMEALLPVGPPSGFPRRSKKWIELHGRELFENMAPDSRSTIPQPQPAA